MRLQHRLAPGGTALITSDCGQMRSFAQRWVTWTCCSRFTCHINRETFARTGRGLNLAHQLANASTIAPTKRRSHALALTSRRLSKAADCWEGSLRRVIAERAYESQTVYEHTWRGLISWPRRRSPRRAGSGGAPPAEPWSGPRPRPCFSFFPSWFGRCLRLHYRLAPGRNGPNHLGLRSNALFCSEMGDVDLLHQITCHIN